MAHSYKNQYFYLFNKLTDLTEEIKKIQQEVESNFIDEADLSMGKSKGGNESKQ